MSQPSPVLPHSPVIQETESHLSHIPKYHGIIGWLMHRFGYAVKVQDPAADDSYYIRVKDVVDEMVGQSVKLSSKGKKLLANRVLEITDPDNRHPLSQEKLKDFFARYYSDAKQNPEQFNTEEGIISEVETIKLDLSDIPQIYYDDSLNEIVNELQPGDFLVRKYHEDNDNLICTLQNLFTHEGYREAYKCSHIAIYLGEINGDHWIAEASMPHDGEPEIRRIKIDDPRFNSKLKNQYLIFRNKNEDTAAEAARLAQNYAIKLLPVSEKEISESDAVASFEYTYLEAVRSLYHSPTLGFYGRHRLLKYYADYHNQIHFEYLGEKRAFFCSHFAMIMESMAEMNTSDKFQDFWENHPAPVYQEGGGKISDIWYSIRKGIWARWMSFWHAKEIDECVTTKLDALRTSPQDAVNYMMTHDDQFEVVGLINHTGDLG